MIFRLVNLHAYQGLPLRKVLSFDEQDPVSALHTRALTITGYELQAQVSARPKAVAYELVILEDPPAPGVYEFAILFGGVVYPISITLDEGELAKDLQTKFIAAVQALLLGLSVCPPSCSQAHEVDVVYPWPGVEWSLSLVDQPEPDQVEVKKLQGNAPMAEFTVSSTVVADQLNVTLLLPAAVTASIPAAGDGPYLWRLVAVRVTDPGDPMDDPPVPPTYDRDDILPLARGHLTMGRA